MSLFVNFGLTKSQVHVLIGLILIKSCNVIMVLTKVTP